MRDKSIYRLSVSMALWVGDDLMLPVEVVLQPDS